MRVSARSGWRHAIGCRPAIGLSGQPINTTSAAIDIAREVCCIRLAEHNMWSAREEVDGM